MGSSLCSRPAPFWIKIGKANHLIMASGCKRFAQAGRRGTRCEAQFFTNLPGWGGRQEALRWRDVEYLCRQREILSLNWSIAFFRGSVKIFGPKDSVPRHPLTPWTIRCMAQTFASASIGDIHDRRALPARFVECEALGMDCDLPRSDIGCSEGKRCPNPP